jgi:hypothetical protein
MGSDLTSEQLQRMVAEAAYYIALRRGFVGGNPVEDWLAAEAEVKRALASVAQEGVLAPISAQELEALMARAREAQVELRAEEVRLRLQARVNGERFAQASSGDPNAIAWEALAEGLRSIAAGKDR